MEQKLSCACPVKSLDTTVIDKLFFNQVKKLLVQISEQLTKNYKSWRGWWTLCLKPSVLVYMQNIAGGTKTADFPSALSIKRKIRITFQHCSFPHTHKECERSFVSMSHRYIAPFAKPANSRNTPHLSSVIDICDMTFMVHRKNLFERDCRFCDFDEEFEKNLMLFLEMNFKPTANNRLNFICFHSIIVNLCSRQNLFIPSLLLKTYCPRITPESTILTNKKQQKFRLLSNSLPHLEPYPWVHDSSHAKKKITFTASSKNRFVGRIKGSISIRKKTKRRCCRIRRVAAAARASAVKVLNFFYGQV